MQSTGMLLLDVCSAYQYVAGREIEPQIHTDKRGSDPCFLCKSVAKKESVAGTIMEPVILVPTTL